MNLTTLLLLSLIIGMVTIIALLAFNVIKIKSDDNGNNNTPNSDSISLTSKTDEQCRDNYIKPTPFKTGFIENTPQPSANLNSKDFKMAINPIYVDYGLPKIPDNCSCLEFIQAP